MVGERIFGEQAKHRRVGAEQLVRQRQKPTALMVWRQRHEPQLPVEPQMVRRDPTGPTLEWTRLARQFVLSPLGLLVDRRGAGALDDELVALTAHAAEGAVSVH